MKIQIKIKRTLDVILGGILLVIFMPLLLITAFFILIKEGRPIFYISKRHISSTREVLVIKFRTMQHDAKSAKYNLNERFMRDGYLDIPLNCEVYTGIGKFLERSQIVEILQLFNVLFHGMSLIGNRPLPRENLQLLNIFPRWKNRFMCPAGMTGITQIVGKHNLKPVDRLELEILYAEVYCTGNILFCDIIIIWYTIKLILNLRF
jgi:lipopolysaccharide/colanic/teichoic acid biosynthesis glycosyltransferase